MIKKIKALIYKAKRKVFFNRCYNRMEKRAIAVFCMCCGEVSTKYRKSNCYDCPYFRDIYGYKEKQ